LPATGTGKTKTIQVLSSNSSFEPTLMMDIKGDFSGIKKVLKSFITERHAKIISYNVANFC
jgi:hypothetical protein